VSWSKAELLRLALGGSHVIRAPHYYLCVKHNFLFVPPGTVRCSSLALYAPRTMTCLQRGRVELSVRSCLMQLVSSRHQRSLMLLLFSVEGIHLHRWLVLHCSEGYPRRLQPCVALCGPSRLAFVQHTVAKFGRSSFQDLRRLPMWRRRRGWSCQRGRHIRGLRTRVLDRKVNFKGSSHTTTAPLPYPPLKAAAAAFMSVWPTFTLAT
jgi:hypothetical protein